MNQMTAYNVMIAALLACGCGRHEKQTNTPAHMATGTHSWALHAPARNCGTGSVARAAEKHLDASLKLMDDFSAALGAQYARFSYDTNRFLSAEHTNYLSRLPDDEFADFLRDFNRACRIRGVGAGEFDLLYLIVTNRLSSAALASAHETYHNIGIAFLGLAFAANDSRSSHISQEWIAMARQAAYQNKHSGYLTDAMATAVFGVPEGISGAIRQRYYEDLYSIITSIAADDELAAMSEKYHTLAYWFRAKMEDVIDPQRALGTYTELRDHILKESSDNRQKHDGLLNIAEENIERLKKQSKQSVQ